MCEKITNQHSKFLLYYHMVYCFIRGGIKLQSKHDTVQIWFMDSCMVRGIPLRICRKYLIRWIALSTWIRTAAIVWLSVTFSWESWSFPAKKEGMLSVTHFDGSSDFPLFTKSAVLFYRPRPRFHARKKITS